MSEISGITGPSALPPSEPTKSQDLKTIAKNFSEEIEVFIKQLGQMDAKSAKDPKQVQEFAATINSLHSNAMQAAGNICGGCTPQ